MFNLYITKAKGHNNISELHWRACVCVYVYIYIYIFGIFQLRWALFVRTVNRRALKLIFLPIQPLDLDLPIYEAWLQNINMRDMSRSFVDMSRSIVLIINYFVQIKAMIWMKDLDMSNRLDILWSWHIYWLTSNCLIGEY